MNGTDLSNFTGNLSLAQLQAIKTAGIQFAVMGCQSETIARANLTSLRNASITDLDVYADVLHRVASTIKIAQDFGCPRVWLDYEPGCFESVDDLRTAVEQVQAAGLEAGIYTGRWCWPLNNTDFANLKLWHAAYETPDFDGFSPYGGWLRPFMWQYSSAGLPGVNVDLDMKEDAPVPPPPPVRVVDGVGLHYSDGSTQQIWPVFGPIVGA